MNKLALFLYAIFLSLFTLFSYVFVDSNLLYLKDLYSGLAFSNRFLITTFYIFFIFIFFFFYGTFIWLAYKKRLRAKDVFILLFITVGILIFSYPAMLSYDIFNYATTSKVLFFYHENPYIVMPIEFAGDSLLGFTHAANKIVLYGPVWIMLTGIPYFLGFGNFVINLFALKFLAGVSYLATIFLVWKISKNIIPVILFTFNPLIIIETLISVHNDIVMMFFVLLSFFLLMKKKVGWAIFFFILSILIKYTTLLLIPIFVFVIWRIIKKNAINWNTIFYCSSLLMLFGFFISPIREEIYPWYSIWFLSFSFLVPNKKLLLYSSIAFSFGLLFRYVPFMLSGTHAGITSLVKFIVTFVPAILVSFYIILRAKLWERIFSR